jgi:Fur family transcriptional regulator, ferric uptake regulator
VATDSICNQVACSIISRWESKQSEPMTTSAQLLKKNGLKRTAAREAILKLLGDAGRPLSHPDIVKSGKGEAHFDRVTVYRTLETLQKRGLLHRIQGMDGTWRYCMHRSEFSGECAGNHIHFLCSKCDQMSCLPEQPLPWVAAPAGAIIQSKQLVVHGLCEACVTEEKSIGRHRRIARSRDAQ